MIDKKKKRLYIKSVILISCLLIVMRIFSLALSKYESISNSTANVDVAFYVLKEEYQAMNLNLASLSPKNNAYLYTFSVGNVDGEKMAETDLTYDLTIRTTTNLPLTYDLFMNEEYDDFGAESIIKENSIERDEDGTYFRIITTDQVSLSYKEGVTNYYQLVINFPSNYNSENYQDIIELLEINVNSQQVTTEN